MLAPFVEQLPGATIPYASALSRVAMPALRHRHAKVRHAALGVVWRCTALPFKAKWRGAGTDTIVDLVGFRPDNELPIAAFYGNDVQFNYLAEVCTARNHRHSRS